MNGHDLITRTEDACARLARAGTPVTFTAVAASTGIARTTLYRNPALRALIDDHRRRALAASTLSGLAADITTLRTAIEAIAARVRHHEEQIRHISRRQADGGTRQEP